MKILSFDVTEWVAVMAGISGICGFFIWLFRLAIINPLRDMIKHNDNRIDSLDALTKQQSKIIDNTNQLINQHNERLNSLNALIRQHDATLNRFDERFKYLEKET